MPVVDYLILTPLNEEFRYLRQAWPLPLQEEKVGKIRFYRALHRYEWRQATKHAGPSLAHVHHGCGYDRCSSRRISRLERTEFAG